MKKLLVLTLLTAGAVTIVVTQWPDIKRYMNMKRM
jgi:hypothetical protein